MTTAVYYEQATGRAYQVLSGPDLGGFPEAPPGSLALLLEASISLPGYVTGTTYVPLPPTPSSIHEFNWVTKQWEDPRTLSDLKAEKWESVKAQRDAQEFGSFTWSGHTFDGDEAAQRRINLAVMGAQAAIIASDVGWSVDWTLADNTSVNLSASDMIDVANALGANIAQAHTVARAKRQLIEQAANIEELDLI